MYLIKYKQDRKWKEKRIPGSSHDNVVKYCMDLMKKDLGISEIHAYYVIMNKRRSLFSQKGTR